jgi:hypothetical protein
MLIRNSLHALTLPVVHLNGTHRDDLFNGYIAAIHALREAEKAIAASAPTGRDYYPSGPTAINEALAEHRARLTVIHKIIAELEHIAMHVQDSP